LAALVEDGRRCGVVDTIDVLPAEVAVPIAVVTSEAVLGDGRFARATRAENAGVVSSKSGVYAPESVREGGDLAVSVWHLFGDGRFVEPREDTRHVIRFYILFDKTEPCGVKVKLAIVCLLPTSIESIID
jgi:hypothetical protein